jgi:hypothetical protein
MLEGCAPAVQYALRRLVRGLGSSREVRSEFAADGVIFSVVD